MVSLISQATTRHRPAAKADVEWQVLTFDSAESVARFAQEVRTALKMNGVFHDVEYIATDHGWSKNELCVVCQRRDGQIRGIATFRVGSTYLEYSLGPVTFLRTRVKQYYLYEAPTFADSDHAEQFVTCFKLIADTAPTGCAIHVSTVPNSTELGRQLGSSESLLARRFFVLPWGKPRPQFGIRWDGKFENYLLTLSGKNRSNLRASAKRLSSDKRLKCRVCRFQSREEIDKFLADAAKISEKTYQLQDMNRGIARGGAAERMIRFAARYGFFLGFILYVDDLPVAFEYGFVFARVHTAGLTGYDPAWAQHHVGNVIFLEMLRDLDVKQVPVDYIDLLTYETLLKRRIANTVLQTQSYYVFPRTVVGWLQYHSLRITNEVSRALGDIVRSRRAKSTQRAHEQAADLQDSPVLPAKEPVHADRRIEFESMLRNEPLLQYRPTIQGLANDLFARTGGSIYYGTGLCTPKSLSIGLPFDILAMVLFAEKLRRKLGLDRILHHVADSHALSNSFATSSEVDALASMVEAVMARVARHLRLGHLSVVRASSFDHDRNYRALLEEIRTDKHEYVRRELADMLWYKRNRSVTVKMGWIVQAREIEEGFDERLYDNEYRRLFGSDLSFVYVKPGRTFDRRRPKASPYICIPGEQRILLHPSERVQTKIDQAKELWPEKTLGGALNHLRVIARVYNEIADKPVKTGSLASRIQCIIDRIFE